MAKRSDIYIMVCGIGTVETLNQMAALDVDFVGLDCRKNSEKSVKLINSLTGTLPDRAAFDVSALDEKPYRVGVFQDDMPQDIVTRVYNYHLDYVQLSGEESAVMIENLRRTLDPDIRKGIKIIKTIRIETVDDLKKCAEYEGVADFFIFEGSDNCGEKSVNDGEKEAVLPDWNLLNDYQGATPFLLDVGISASSLDALRQFSHPKFAGIYLNAEAESAQGEKDTDAIREFVAALRA